MKDKSCKEDIGFVDELIELCKNLISLESHAFNSYLTTGKEKWLKSSQLARKKRTTYLSLITKKDNAQGWCFSKHICECLMRLQECYTRFLSTNQLEEAKICVRDYGDLYLLFMEINEIGGGNVSTAKSSA